MTMLGSLEVLMDCSGSSMTLVMEGAQPRDRLLLLFPCMLRVTDPCERLSEEEESLLREREPCIALLLCRSPMWSMDGLLVAFEMDRGGIWVAVSVGCVRGSVYVCVWGGNGGS